MIRIFAAWAAQLQAAGVIRLRALHELQNVLRVGLRPPREERRADAHPQDQGGDHEKYSTLARIQVRQPAILVLGDASKEDALIGPQQIHSRENYSKRGPGRPRRVFLNRPRQDQELADEAV